jgi:hypothetical protein
LAAGGSNRSRAGKASIILIAAKDLGGKLAGSEIRNRSQAAIRTAQGYLACRGHLAAPPVLANLLDYSMDATDNNED